jgi:heme/copper-type cytochrome/quinol oxidase subunit 2
VSSAVVVFLVCVVACAVAHVAILVSSVSTRVSANASPSVPRPRILVELMWALVPILALALVFTATWSAVRENEQRHPPEVLKVAR